MENENKQEIRRRWALIPDIFGVIDHCGLEYGNPALLLADLVANEDFTTLELLEGGSPEWAQEVADLSLIETDVKAGKKIKNACNEVYQFILGYNKRRELNQEQADAMEEQYGEIQRALLGGRLDKAYAMILETPVDGEMVTEDMKTKVLKVIERVTNL